MPTYTFTRGRLVRQYATLELEADSALEAAQRFATKEEEGEENEFLWEDGSEEIREEWVESIIEDETGATYNRHKLAPNEED